jgi:hypothetical protein
MKTQFRCANSRPEEWHFEEFCPSWPAEDFTYTEEVPPTTRLCVKCIDLKARELLSDMLGSRESSHVVQ